MNTIVYVDGFNLYYGSLKGSPYKWLDLYELFRRTLPPGHVLVKVKYFTARVSPLPSNPNAPVRQDIYLRALKAHLHAGIEIFEGHFSLKQIWLPKVADPTQFVKVLRSEEKGSDVNLSVELVNDAWGNQFDSAAVVSNDADLGRALKIVKQYKKKRVLLYTPGAPGRKPVSALTRWANKQVKITSADLAASQLPSPIVGTALSKPPTW